MLGLRLPAARTRRGWPASIIEGRQMVTLLMRFAGITPELVENVRRGAKIEGRLAWSHTLRASRIGARPEHAGVGGATPWHTSAGAMVPAPGDGYRSRGSVIRHRRGGVLPGPARTGARTQIDPAMCMKTIETIKERG